MWIGVDFDGTLAHQVTGAPIPPVVELVKGWLAQKRDVRIFTARAARWKPQEIEEVRWFCQKYLGKYLPIVNTKDSDMDFLLDDRAVSVKHNEGEVCDLNDRDPALSEVSEHGEGAGERDTSWPEI